MELERKIRGVLARGLLAALLVAIALAFACAPTGFASPASLSELKGEAARVRGEMTRLEARLQAVGGRYQAAREELDAVNQRLVETRLRLRAAERLLDAQRQVVAERLVAMYKADDYTWFDLVAGSASFSDAETAASMIGRIASADRRAEQDLVRLEGEVRGLQDGLEGRRVEVRRAETALETQRVALEGVHAARSAALRDIVARIKKILAEPELLMKSGGKVTQVTWAKALLKDLGMPLTADNVAAIVAWEMAEGGHWYNDARYNPLNTTQNMPGATVFNSVGVKAYTSWAQGMRATVITMHNGFYGGILAALRDGDDAEAVAAAVASSPWGTNSFEVD